MNLLMDRVSAAWYRPIANMVTEKVRGNNVLVGYDSGPQKTDTLAAWIAAAEANWFSVVLQANQDTLKLVDNPAVVGYFLMPDEANGAGNTTPQVMFNGYCAIKAVTSKPVIITLDGGHVTQFPAQVSLYCAACDIAIVDRYPINYNEAGGIPLIGSTVKIVKSSCNKPVWNAQECCDMKIREQGWINNAPAGETPAAKAARLKLQSGMRGPTASEIGQEINSAMNGGSGGILWFEDSPGSGPDFSYDGCTPEQSGAIAAVNAIWQAR